MLLKKPLSENFIFCAVNFRAFVLRSRVEIWKDRVMHQDYGALSNLNILS